MPIHLKEVNSLRELKKFIRFPFDLYRGNKYWIPPYTLHLESVLS